MEKIEFNYNQIWHDWSTDQLRGFLENYGISNCLIEFQALVPREDGTLKSIHLEPETEIDEEPDSLILCITPPKGCTISMELLNQIMFRIQGNLWPSVNPNFNVPSEWNDYDYDHLICEDDLCLHTYSIKRYLHLNPPIYKLIWKQCYCH